MSKAAKSPRNKDQIRTQGLSDRTVGYILFAPTFFILIIVNVYILANMVYISLHDYDIFSDFRDFVGLRNYLILFEDSRLLETVWNDLVFTFGNLSFQIVVGVLLALLLNRRYPGRNVMRSLVIFSYLLPTLVAVLAWRFMLSDFTGIITHYIRVLNRTFGMSLPTSLLGNPDTAMLSVIMISNWKFFPFAVITLLAQLQSVDPNLYEAATIDGANAFQRFRYVTWPSLLPVIYMILLLRFIWTFNKFDIIYLTTGGGPLGATETPPLLIYHVFFGQYVYGRASAIAVLMFLFLVATSFVYFKFYQGAYRRLQ